MSSPPECRSWVAPASRKLFKKKPRETISDSLGWEFGRLSTETLQKLENDNSIHTIMKDYYATKDGNSALDSNLQNTWDSILEHRTVDWTISQTYLLEALGSLLQRDVLFCQINHEGMNNFHNCSPIMGFGPLFMERGVLVSPL